MPLGFVKPERTPAGASATDGARCVRPGDRICDMHELEDGGRGVRFMLTAADGLRTAFVVRHAGQVYGYLNECAHRALELDWVEGEFFDAYREFLICAVHGARYDPVSGACIDGACAGRGLAGLPLEIAGDEVRLARELSVPCRPADRNPDTASTQK